MMSYIRILLSADGQALKVFLKDDHYDYQEIKQTQDLKEDKFNHHHIVKTNLPLLEMLVEANTAEKTLMALCKIRTAILEDNRQNLESQKSVLDRMQNFSQNNIVEINKKYDMAFEFFHENSRSLPNHFDMFSVNSTHEEPLEMMIKFVKENCYSDFESPERRDFINGFRYQQKNWWDLSWVSTYMSTEQNGNFVAGRKAYKRS